MNWLREIFGVFRTRLGRKAAVPVLLIVIIFLVPTFFAFRSERIADETSAELASRNEIAKHLSDMEGALRTEQISVYEMVYEHKTEQLDNFETAAASVQFFHDEATEHVASAEEQALLDECQSLHERAAFMVGSRIAPDLKSENLADHSHAEMIVLENELQGMYGRMTELGGQLEATFAKDTSDARIRQTEAREFASDLTWASMIFAVIAGFLIMAAYARQLVYPIKRMSGASLQIARGDLSQRVEVKGQDELADMGRAFNDMADSLERRTEQLEREKARIRSIHQSIGDGILVIDRAGVIISVNPAAERILERPVTQLERTTNTGVPALQEALARKTVLEQMVACWEEKDCAKVDCPSHGSQDRRCWLQCGTFCYNQIQGTFKQKRDACERCDVFIKNAVIDLTLEIGNRHYSTSILPILDDLGQEEGRTIVMHDITEVLQAKESVERHSAELAAINSINEVVSESLDLQTTLDNALEKIQEIRGADAVSIHLLAEEDGLYLAAEKGLSDELRKTMARIPIGFGCPGVAVDTGGPVNVGDLRNHDDVPAAALEAGFLSSMAVPLKSKNKVIGSLSLAARRLNAFNSEDAKLMGLIGVQVGVAVDNSILYEDSLRHSREALAKSRIVSTLTSTLELEKVFDDFSEAIKELVDFDRFSVIIGDGAGPITKLLLPSGEEPALRDPAGTGFSMKGTAAEWVIKNNSPYLSGDIAAETKYREQELFVAEGYRSQLNLPLVVKGTVLGSMNMTSSRVDAFDGRTVETLQPVADQVALTIANQKLFEDVARSKVEWETTFDSASEGIAMVGTNHRIIRLNKAAAEMMGGTVEDFVGRNCFEVIHDAGKRPAKCLMNEAVTGCTSARGEQEMDDGRTLELVVDPVYDEEGRPAGAVHFLRNITEAKRLRQQLLQSEKMIAVGQLVAGVAHEINNPLTGVIGYAQLLLKRDIDDLAKKDAEGIYREADRATRIVRHLLSFARKHQPERRTVDINAVIRESVELKAYEMRVNNIAMETDLDESLPMTVADPHQLQQVFVNLINNAEQAMLEYRGSGLLKISTALVDDRIRISFVDNGPGISDEIADRIFDPFFTTKDVGKGTGLGLSVCYGVAQDHGGRIWTESVKGQGADVIVELPVVAASPVRIERDNESISRRLGKILLVDDEAAIRQVLTETLRQAGHEVETAGNGVVALRMLKKKHYDCVVSDVKMPLMDGPSLHKAVVEMDPEMADSFIFISGDTISPDTRTYLNRVENPRLAKPFDLADLETALQKLLAAREVRHD